MYLYELKIKYLVKKIRYFKYFLKIKYLVKKIVKKKNVANLPRFSHHLFIFFVYCFLLLHEDSKESLNVNNFRKFIDVHLNCIIFRRIFPFT